jgi:uncharacterized membrane protein
MSADEAARVKELLLAAPVPPVKVDLDRAIADGRRRERGRRLIWATGSAALVALVVVGGAAGVGTLRSVPAGKPVAPASAGASASPRPASPGPASPPPSGSPSPSASAGTVDAGACTVAELPGLTGLMPTIVDPTGTYVVVDQAVEVGNSWKAVLVTGGQRTTLPLPAGSTNEQTNGINASGWMVGMGSNGGSGQVAFVIKNGTATRLPKLPGYQHSTAWAINAAGDIVGAAWNDGDDVPVLWPAASPGTVQRLGSGAGDAMAIGDDGTIAGTAGDGEAPWVWDVHGNGHALTTPAGSAHGKVFAIRGDWAAGWAGSDAGGAVSAARWNLRTGAVETFAGMGGPARMVNARGDLASTMFEGGGVVRDGAPFNPGTGPYGAGVASPIWISDDGRTLIGSVQSFAGGQTVVRAVTWHC